MARFFIDRPVFAWVISILIMGVGVLSILTLPIAQYPQIAPPSVAPLRPSSSTSFPAGMPSGFLKIQPALRALGWLPQRF